MSEINMGQSTTNLDDNKMLVVVEPVMKTAVEALSVLGKTRRLTIIGKGWNNIVKKLSRVDKSKIYCSGIQFLNPYLINLKTRKVENFNEILPLLYSK